MTGFFVGRELSNTTLEDLSACNFGQHPATLAGMTSTNGDCVVTLDEDSQHDPCDIIRLLDVAVEQDVQLVYAQPTKASSNEPQSTAITRHQISSQIKRKHR